MRTPSKAGFVVMAATAMIAMSVSTALAAPVLPAGQTSGPHNSRGTCTECHDYAAPAVVAPPVVATPAATQSAPKLSKPTISKAKPKRKKAFSIAGKIGSADAANTRVKLTIQRKVAGKWKTVATKSATLKAGAMKYSLKVKLSKAGSYRVRASHAADVMHLSGVSKYKTFKVK